MDTFVDSSYSCGIVASRERTHFHEEIDYWIIDQYIEALKYAILHLLYARFWTKVTRDLNLIKIDEPLPSY